jgi:glyoxylase-like metal-dependent hydrolase (beta-lactamase superfamily II)
MLMLDRRVLRAGSSAIGAAVLAPTAPRLRPRAPSGQAGAARLLPLQARRHRDHGRQRRKARVPGRKPGKLPPAQKPLVTQANLKLASPRLRLIKAGAEVAPGVTTIDTPGHTPGHMSVHISSGREEMLLTGDVVVNSAVSFLHPEWPFEFDLDVPQATKTRMAFLDRAAADKTLVGSYHLPFPGFGHVVREGSAYRWLPADWRWTT